MAESKYIPIAVKTNDAMLNNLHFPVLETACPAILLATSKPIIIGVIVTPETVAVRLITA